MGTRERGTGARLRGALTIARAEELKRLLLVALSGTDDVLLDVEAVTEVDLTGLQLLCAAHRAALQAGRRVVLDYTRSPLLAETLLKAGYMRHAGCMAHENCLWAEAPHG